MAEQDKPDMKYKETFTKFESPLQDYVQENIPMLASLIRVNPHGQLLVDEYPNHHAQHLAYQGNPTDIWVASYPKCGTTWTQELVWLVARGLDHPEKDKSLHARFPLFEWDSLFGPKHSYMYDSLPEDHPERPGGQRRILAEQEHPKLLKTHLFHQLLPISVMEKGSRVVYVMRDPKDVCVSYYFHAIRTLGYKGDFDHFVQLFLSDAIFFGPYWASVLGYWNVRNSKNILLLRYEDMKVNLPRAIGKVTEFLGVNVGENDIAEMARRLNFSSMKSNPATNNEEMAKRDGQPEDIQFMRKGIVGDHKNHLSEDHLMQFKIWTEKWLEGTDFPFYRD